MLIYDRSETAFNILKKSKIPFVFYKICNSLTFHKNFFIKIFTDSQFLFLFLNFVNVLIRKTIFIYNFIRFQIVFQN